jgi:hypothetical protein
MHEEFTASDGNVEVPIAYTVAIQEMTCTAHCLGNSSRPLLWFRVDIHLFWRWNAALL